MCEVAHTDSKIGQAMGGAVPGLQLGSVRAMEGAMPKVDRWSRNVPRIELDQRSREARLRLEEIERLVVSKQRQVRLRRIFYVLRIRISLGAPQQNRRREPLSDRRPFLMPTVFAMLSLQQALH